MGLHKACKSTTVCTRAEGFREYGLSVWLIQGYTKTETMRKRKHILFS